MAGCAAATCPHFLLNRPSCEMKRATPRYGESCDKYATRPLVKDKQRAQKTEDKAARVAWCSSTRQREQETLKCKRITSINLHAFK